MAIRLLSAAVAVLTLVASAGAVSGPARLEEVLARAAAWTQRFADEGTFVVAEERYEQEYRHRRGSDWDSERRELRSEIVIVRTPPSEAARGFPWVQFRDVQEVDGRPLADRQGRLERLFHDPSGDSYAAARALVQESARFNLGPAIRTVNVPAFGLFFLVAANQPRFRFAWKAEETVDGARVAVVEYRERERPTIIRSPQRDDRPATGTFWIEAATGRVMRTLLAVDADRHWRAEIEVNYGRDARLDLWAPMAMRERYARDSSELVAGAATYSNFRRFETTARVLAPR